MGCEGTFNRSTIYIAPPLPIGRSLEVNAGLQTRLLLLPPHAGTQSIWRPALQIVALTLTVFKVFSISLLKVQKVWKDVARRL